MHAAARGLRSIGHTRIHRRIGGPSSISALLGAGVTYYPGEGCGYLKSANGPLLSCNHVAAPCVPATHFSRATARRRAAERRDRRLRMLLRHAA